MDRQLLRAELIRDEGCLLDAYKDTMGYWTIGVGHLLGTSMRMEKITQAEAEALLNSDIDEAIDLVSTLVPSIWQVSATEFMEERERALVNMAFNLGNRLRGFKKFLAAVDRRDWTTAAVEMMDSVWAKQVGARADRLRHMILKGETP